MSRGPFSVGVKILGGGAVLGMTFLLVGYLLPSDWEARAERVVNLPAESVFGYLDSPEGWGEWTPWPDAAVERSGAQRGEGARLAWDDPELGSGSFTLVRTVRPERIDYRVQVGESMTTEGEIVLVDAPGGVRIVWTERGNLGRNPLMGYWARSMDRAQGAELEKGLERLEAAARRGAPRATSADSSGDAPERVN